MKRSATPSDVAYDKVREIALRFPAAEEKLSHGAPSFHVRGKMFLTFVDDHHGDGRLAVWCKSTLEDQRDLVSRNPARFFVPPYVGVRGWVGVNVDARNADWIELAILVEHGWRSVAPARALGGDVASGNRALPPPTPRVTTDAGVARKALDRFTEICLALPYVERERESKHATFRVRSKVFAYFLDNHHGDGAIAACVKGEKGEHARLVAAHPEPFYLPSYVGAHGYMGIRLDIRSVDWKDVRERVAAAYQRVISPAARSKRAMRAAPRTRRTRSA